MLSTNRAATVRKKKCWLPRNTVFQLFLHLVSVTWPVGQVTYRGGKRTASRQGETALDDGAAGPGMADQPNREQILRPSDY
jgi:hypothetical protein